MVPDVTEGCFNNSRLNDGGWSWDRHGCYRFAILWISVNERVKDDGIGRGESWRREECAGLRIRKPYVVLCLDWARLRTFVPAANEVITSPHEGHPGRREQVQMLRGSLPHQLISTIGLYYRHMIYLFCIPSRFLSIDYISSSLQNTCEGIWV